MEETAAALKTAGWTRQMRPSMLYRLARLFGTNPDIISFAGGAPDPDLFPNETLSQVAADVMGRDPDSLQYGRDLPSLKQEIVKLMAQRGVNCSADNISITAGGQHGMDVLTRLFLDPGGQVMLEELVYTGIQQTVMPLQPDVLTIPVSPETGMDLDVVERHLSGGARPAFLYTIPDAHNPAGVTLTHDQRRRLAALARQYNLPIIEDDAYGFLNYEAENSTPLRALDEEHVVYLGTFSKIVAPGFRLGWILSPAGLTAPIQTIKQLSMLSVVPLSQHIVAGYLMSNPFWAHLGRIRYEYGRRRDAMLQAMDRHFPAEAQWTRPGGGMFIWVRLPDGIDTEALVYRCVEEEAVAFIPGKAFVTDPDNRRYDSYLRLTFVRYGPEQLEEGIRRLGRALRRAIANRQEAARVQP